MSTIVPPTTPTQATGEPRRFPSVAELAENYPHLDPWERLVWARRELKALRTRPPIPESLRREVYERDGWACLHCGSAERLSLDHIIPWSLCGPDTAANLQTLCLSCNSRKGARV